jgi:hypothetical protein
MLSSEVQNNMKPENDISRIEKLINKNVFL